MKKTLFTLISALILAATTGATETAESTFGDLFQPIAPTDLAENVFKAVGQDFTVITAGTPEHYNAMTASFGGWGILFGKPVVWCFLRANRYTFELMKQEGAFTTAYFPERYKDQVLFFGSKTGRDTDKMKETTLSMIQTPAGNIAFREARLILECKLIELTTVSPDDFLTEEGQAFIADGYADAGDYHKLAFGEITAAWIPKSQPAFPGKVNLGIRVTKTDIRITNLHGPELEGKTFKIYLNSSPSKDPYIGTVKMPAFNENTFFYVTAAARKSDGRIFNPDTHRVQEIWLGVDDYAIQKYFSTE